MLPGCIAGFTAGHMLPLNPVFYQVFISALFFPVSGYRCIFYRIQLFRVYRLCTLFAEYRGTDGSPGYLLVTCCFSH